MRARVCVLEEEIEELKQKEARDGEKVHLCCCDLCDLPCKAWCQGRGPAAGTLKSEGAGQLLLLLRTQMLTAPCRSPPPLTFN